MARQEGVREIDNVTHDALLVRFPVVPLHSHTSKAVVHDEPRPVLPFLQLSARSANPNPIDPLQPDILQRSCKDSLRQLQGRDSAA
jgi:hypothetical protein